MIKRLLLIALTSLSFSAYADLKGAIANYHSQNYAAALPELQSLASAGDKYAQSLLGFMYDIGQGVPQDYKEALKWYRLAADQGNADAQGNLGFMYHKGQGVPQDYKEALKWFRLAADRGNAVAQYNLGIMYEYGKGGVSSSKVVAYALYNYSASLGYVEAVNKRNKLLGSMSSSQINAGQNLSRELAKKGSFLNALDQYLKNLAMK